MSIWIVAAHKHTHTHNQFSRYLYINIQRKINSNVCSSANRKNTQRFKWQCNTVKYQNNRVNNLIERKPQTDRQKKERQKHQPLFLFVFSDFSVVSNQNLLSFSTPSFHRFIHPSTSIHLIPHLFCFCSQSSPRLCYFFFLVPIDYCFVFYHKIYLLIYFKLCVIKLLKNII